MEEQFALIHLNRVQGFGPVSIRQLREAYGSVAKAFEQTPSAWATRFKVKLENAKAAFTKTEFEKSQEEIETAARMGIKILSWEDSEYPESLLNIDFSPPVLYLLGNTELLSKSLLGFAVVGSRTPTVYGKAQAEQFAAALSNAGLTIISGMARGVDAAAHRSCLQNPAGKTIAVLGSGFQNIYPKDDAPLLQALKHRGLLISEFSLEVLPHKGHFPRRNRIIAGLAKGILVVEAAAKSGSLGTAQWALDQGKDVFAIPGRVDNPMARGCHFLIREGARLVETPQQILSEYGVTDPSNSNSQPSSDSELSKALQHGMKTIDQLSEELNKGPEEILDELIELELNGQVVRAPGGFYRRVQ